MADIPNPAAMNRRLALFILLGLAGFVLTSGSQPAAAWSTVQGARYTSATGAFVLRAEWYYVIQSRSQSQKSGEK